jgi:hypothetical protein
MPHDVLGDCLADQFGTRNVLALLKFTQSGKLRIRQIDDCTQGKPVKYDD